MLETFCEGGVPVAKWQTVYLYRVSKLFPPMLHCYSVSLVLMEFWTKGAPSGIWRDRNAGKNIVLEFLSSMFSAQVGTIANREQEMC